MNPRILIIAALSAAITVCLYLFLGGETSVTTISPGAAVPSGKVPTSPSDAAGENPASEHPSDATGKKPAMNWKRFAMMMNSAGEPGERIPEPTPEDIARFLAKHGETAVNLVAAFETTRDRRLLERALELFPNSPIVLMAAIEVAPQNALKPGEKYQPDAGRMALIERFKAADPNNPLPWIFSAEELFKAGQTADAVADIRAALDRPAFYTYGNERTDSSAQLYEDLGLHPVEASLLAMANLSLPHMTAAQQTSRSLMEWQKSATDSGDTAAADDALRLTYNLGRTFATPEASRTLIGQLVGISMESRALKALPADAQPAWLTVNPAQRLVEMDRQKQNAKEIVAGLQWVVQSQNEEILSEYVRRMRSESEAAASEWLKAQKK